MKILFVNRHVGEVGGVECYINALVRRLQQSGHRTGIIHGDDAGSEGQSGKYYRVNDLWVNELYLSAGTKKILDDILDEFYPDVIYLNGIENGAAIDFFAGRAKTIQYIHAYRAVDPDGKMLLYDPLEVNRGALSLSCFLRAFTRRSMPRSPIKGIKAYVRAKSSLEAVKRLEKIIVASKNMKKTLMVNGVSAQKIEVIPYFVDHTDPDHKEESDKKHILFCGRIAEGKGLELLIEVLSRINEDYVLDVAGTGPAAELCRDTAVGFGIAEKIIFHGWIDHAGLVEHYRRASFLVVPSLWPEPFGICGIEGAFFGKPCIAFDVGGISDWLIDGETGFLVEPYRKDIMADKIRFFLTTPDKAMKLGENARKLAIKKYSPELHIERLMEIFKN